jgi:hypothetical protein
MRRSKALGAASAAALIAGSMAVSGVFGSSHREAPNILKDPTADNTDVYAYTAQDAPGSLTVVANWIPLADPAGGPNFFPLDEDARYYIKIDNTGDGYEDVAYRYDFKTKWRNPNSFLYAAPPVNSINDRNLNLVQTYDVYKEKYDENRKLVSVRPIVDDAPVVPDNIGPKTMPNFSQIEAGGTVALRGGGKTFVGPADDAFFVDLGSIFDGINIDKPGRPNIGLGNQGGGKDDVAGYNTKSFVLQVPEREVTRDGKPVSGAGADNSVVGVWSTTERRSDQVLGGYRGPRGQRPKWVQVSRLANPLFNEVLVPAPLKDKYNRTSPAADGPNFGRFVRNPEPARLLNALFGLGVQENDRKDLVQVLLKGVPGLTQIGKNPAAADTLKVNLGVPPAAKENRFGVLAGDVAGFPNGRRLADDVVDIELRAIAGALLSPPKNIPLGDGVDQNDKPFRAQFPYVGQAFDGFNSNIKRIEPPHAPVPQPPTP